MKRFVIVPVLSLFAACTRVPAPTDLSPAHGPLGSLSTPGSDVAAGLAHHRTGLYVAGVQNADFAGSRPGAGDAFVRRYDADGTLLWKRQFGTRRTDTALDAASDAAGNVYVAVNTAGRAAGGEGNDESRVYRYAPNGAASGTWRLGGADAVYTTGLAAHGGDVYAVGVTADYRTFNYDGFVQKLGKDGSSGWRVPIATKYLDAVYGAATDGQKNLYVLGTERSQGPGPEGDQPLFVRKYTSGGTVPWTERFRGDASTIAIAVDGRRVYVASQAYDSDFCADLRLTVLSTSGSRLPGKRFDLGGGEYVADLSACDGWWSSPAGRTPTSRHLCLRLFPSRLWDIRTTAPTASSSTLRRTGGGSGRKRSRRQALTSPLPFWQATSGCSPPGGPTAASVRAATAVLTLS